MADYEDSQSAGLNTSHVSTKRARYVARPRVDEVVTALLSGEQQGIAVWSAAGSGKTVLLRKWQQKLESDGVDVLWFDGQELADHSVITRVRSVFDELPAVKPSQVNAGLQRVFIVDDAHAASSGPARETLTHIIAELPADVGLIVAGRYQPLSKAAYALSAVQDFVELRTEDLSFTLEETRELLAAHNCILDDDTLHLFLHRTGGWAAALALAAPWLARVDNQSKAVTQFDGDTRAIADYLVSEVLGLLNPDEWSVLLRTAIRPTVPADLLAFLTTITDAGAILYRIAEQLSLVSVDSEGYHFHPVLLSHLQAASRRSDAAAWTASHTAAYHWFSAQGQGKQALEEAITSTVETDILQGLDRFGLELVFMGEADGLLRSMSTLPRFDSELHVIVAHLLLETPDFSDGHRATHLFELALQHQDPGKATSSRWMAAVLALRCFHQASETSMEEGLKRLRQPDLSALRSREFGLDLLVETAEAWCLGHLGEPDQALQTLRAVAASCHRAGYIWLFLVTTELASKMAAVGGHWEFTAAFEDQVAAELHQLPSGALSTVQATAAITTAARAFRRCEKLPIDRLQVILAAESNGSMAGLSIAARGLIHFQQLDSEANVRIPFDHVLGLMDQYIQRYPALFAAVGLRMVSRAVQLDGRGAASEIADMFCDSVGSNTLEAATVQLATFIPSMTSAAAENQLLAAVSHANNALHAGAPVAAWLLLAHFAQEQGRGSEADRRVFSALKMAHRTGSIQPFAARNGEGARLLAARAGRLGQFEGLGDSIRDKVAAILPRDAATSSGFESLTPRERDILKELPLHQSMGDIARLHCLSLNTVKTHMRSIYQKLDVPDRSAAVAVARRHGLI